MSPQLSNKNKSQTTNNTTTVSKPDVELLQKTIQRLEHENSELKLELEPGNYIYDSVINYLENVVSKASPDIFDAGYAENTSSTLGTYSINVDTCSHPIEIDRWNRFSDAILHDMWENIIEAGQHEPMLAPNQAGLYDDYDSSKTDNLKKPKSKQELSDILHETIEKPAARLVNAVEQRLGWYPNITCVWYQDHVSEEMETEASEKFAESYPENSEMLDSTSHTQPDACFFGYGKLLVAGIHVDPQSLTMDSYRRFERFYEQHKRDKKDFTDMLRELKQKDESEAGLSDVITVFNIILITYSLMVKYNLNRAYATTGKCWLILFKWRNTKSLKYDFFESSSYTEPPRKDQSTDYQYLKKMAFVKVACLVMDIVFKYSRDDMADAWAAAENAKSNTSQESNSVKKQKTDHQPSSSSSSSGDDALTINYFHPLREYCTQKCLLGLKSNAPMHKKCPNYAIHQKYSDSRLHPIKNTDLGVLFYRQLENKRGGCKKIDGLLGNNGVIYKITVYPYGYTFIGKGAGQYDEEGLRDEIYVYKHLEKIQGKWIPIYLGSLRLSDTVRVDRIDDDKGTSRSRLIMFLSYVGEDMNRSDVEVSHDEINKLKEILHELGIWHDDLNLGNIIWSKELNHGMLIDMGKVLLRNK